MGLLWFIPLVSQVVEQVKTYDLRKIIKTRVISKFRRSIFECPVSPAKMVL